MQTRTSFFIILPNLFNCQALGCFVVRMRVEAWVYFRVILDVSYPLPDFSLFCWVVKWVTNIFQFPYLCLDPDQKIGDFVLNLCHLFLLTNFFLYYLPAHPNFWHFSLAHPIFLYLYLFTNFFYIFHLLTQYFIFVPAHPILLYFSPAHSKILIFVPAHPLLSLLLGGHLHCHVVLS